MKPFRALIPCIFILAALQSCKGPLPQELIPPAPAYCIEEGSAYLIPLVDSCRTHPFPRMGNIWTPPNEQKYQYFHPIVSVLDPNLIIYQRHESDSSKPDQLWTMNLCTGEKKLLVNEIHSPVTQSCSGWILYETGNKSWKVKSNGDSLTQLANFLYQFDWHPSGHQIVGRMAGNNWAILDAEGKLLRVLTSIKNYEGLRWSPDGKYLAMQGAVNDIAYVHLYEVATGLIERIPVPTSSGHFWVDKDHLLIRDKAFTGNIVKINIHTHQIVSVVEPFCVNIGYFPYSMSTDGQYLLCGYNLYEESIPGSSILNSYTKLVVMDINGGNKREIVLE